MNLYRTDEKYRTSSDPKIRKKRATHHKLIFHITSITSVTTHVVIIITATTAIPK